MDERQRKAFEERVRRIDKDHRTGAHVAKAHVGMTTQRRRFRFPWGFFILAAAGYVFVKGFLFAYMGEQAYRDRLETLAQGGLLSKAGAVVMAPEPASTTVAGWLEGIVSGLNPDR